VCAVMFGVGFFPDGGTCDLPPWNPGLIIKFVSKTDLLGS